MAGESPAGRSADGTGLGLVLRAAGPPQLVAAAHELAATGLHTWTDGTMGLVERNGTTYGFAANGATTARTVVDGSTFCADPVVGIEVTGHGSDYAAFGPVHLMASGRLLAFVHHETHDDLGFWSRIGMAWSDDWWSASPSFHHMGYIVEPNLAIDSPYRRGSVDVGSGAYAVVSDAGVEHLVVWFREAYEGGWVTTNLSAARAPLHEVHAAAAAGRVVPWTKHRGGRWGEPGLGGVPSELLPTARGAGWFDVARAAPHDLLIGVVSEYGKRGRCLATLSRDGVRWSAPHVVHADDSGDELFFLTVVPDSVNDRVVHSDAVRVLRTRSSTGGYQRWADASVELLGLGVSWELCHNVGGSARRRDVATEETREVRL
jgi:hypothetical protein